MRSTRVYTIFWEPSSLPSGVQPFESSPSYTETVNGYFAGVAADSGKPSNVYSLAAQYHGPAGEPIEYLTTFPGKAGAYSDAVIDTKALPATECTDLVQPGGATLPVCLTEQQLAVEIASVVKANGWPTGFHDMVFLYTPQGVGSCFAAGPESASNQCSYTYYCAYHDALENAGKITVFANMPYEATPTCDDQARPGGSTAGPAIDATSHEHNEAITDPTGEGWWDSSGEEATNADWGFENGDLCVLESYSETFGALLEGSSALGPERAFNQLIGGSPYLLQMEWSDLAGRCAQRLPSLSFTPPATATTGTAIALNATATTDSTASPITRYEWTFGDNNTSVDGSDTANLASTTHSFCAPGEYEVKLAVEDEQGDPASIAHTVTVSGPNVCSGSPPVKEPVKEPAKEPVVEPSLAPTLPQAPQGTSETKTPSASTSPATAASAGTPSTPPASTTSQFGVTPLSANAMASLLGLPAAGAQLTASRSVGLGRAQCPPACLVRIRLVAIIAGSSKRHHPQRHVTIGTARITVRSSGARSLIVNLNAAGRALLRSHRRLSVNLSAIVSGAEGAHWTIIRSLRLVLSGRAAARHSRS